MQQKRGAARARRLSMPDAIVRECVMRFVLVVLTLLLPVKVNAQQFERPGNGFLEPFQPNTYGPGINSDATGRPFSWQPLPGNGPADPLSPVRPDVYGPGVGMDQYGRAVRPACPPFQQSC